MRVRKLEVVAEGVQRNGKEVAREVLESVVRNFNPGCRPPVTRGHPKEGDDQIPALGRIAVRGVGQNAEGKAVLLCEQYYTPELEEYEDKGYLEGQSVGIYPLPGKDGEFYLHHVAQLGSLPPAADVKTLDVVQLANADEATGIFLFADVGGRKQETNNDEDIMDIKKLTEAVKACSDEEKKALGEALGFKESATPEDKDKKSTTDDKGKDGGDDKTLDALKNMQKEMGEDRRERLTELADARKIPADARVRTMIKKADAIELCANGDTSSFGNIKALIEEVPASLSTASSSSALFENLELSDDGKPVEAVEIVGY